jgi:hypothetical protein
MDAILRLALDDGSGGDPKFAKWEPGTVLAAYDIDAPEMFCGAMADFLYVRIRTSRYTLDEMKAWRCMKRLDLSEIKTPVELSALATQKTNGFVAKTSPATCVVKFAELLVKPKLEAHECVNLDELKLSDTDIKHQPRMTVDANEEEIKAVEESRVK